MITQVVKDTMQHKGNTFKQANGGDRVAGTRETGVLKSSGGQRKSRKWVLNMVGHGRSEKLF